jgi:hypothetical protein
VSTEEGHALAEELRMPYYETSARENHNVEEAFFGLAEEIKRHAPPRFSQRPEGSIGVGLSEEAPGGGACGQCGGFGDSGSQRMQSMAVGRKGAEPTDGGGGGGIIADVRKKLGVLDRFAEGDEARRRDASQ